MSTPDLCTEEEVSHLVHTFYAKVRDDKLLSPIFSSHISNWNFHLSKMVDFWSSVLRGTARYRGTPMPTHNALPQIDIEMFHRWLKLFHQTTCKLANTKMRNRADELAERIAQSLWYGYQIHLNPDKPPDQLRATLND